MIRSRGVCGLVGVSLLTACSVVVTEPTRTSGSAVPSATSGCNSALGSYNLPKTVLRVRYQEYLNPTTGKLSNTGFDVSSMVVMDGDPVCLGYIGTPTSSDDLRVYRSRETAGTTVTALFAGGTKDENLPARSDVHSVAAGGATGLLQIVTSKSTDYSGVILRKIARTIFTVLSGSAGFTPVGPIVAGRNKAEDGTDAVVVDILDLTFDPLDPDELANANAVFAEEGLCLAVGEYSFNPSKATPESYCAAPVQTERLAPPVVPELILEPQEVPSSVPGLLYRPRRDYNVFIYGKRDPKGDDPWRQLTTVEVKMENLSPIFSIGVERALFAQRRTAIVFDDGALQGFCVTKGSELLGFIEVPLEVVRSIVKLPTEILKIDLNSVQERAKLVQAEQRLLALQDKILRQREDLEASELTIADDQTPSDGRDTPVARPFTGDAGSVTASEAIKAEGSFLSEICKKTRVKDL